MVVPCVPSVSVTGNVQKTSFIPEVASYEVLTSLHSHNMAPNFEGSALTLV